jgi:hypothetical protein
MREHQIRAPFCLHCRRFILAYDRHGEALNPISAPKSS